MMDYQNSKTEDSILFNGNRNVPIVTLPYRIKADGKGLLILFFLVEIIFIFGVVVSAIRCPMPLWANIFMITFLPLSWGFLLATFEIKIAENKIICKEFFNKNKEILFSDIKSVKFAYGLGKSTARGYGFFQLVIAHKAKIKPIIINIEMLSTKDLTTLVDVILTKNPSIEADKNVERIREKKLNEVLSTAMKLSVGQISWWLLLMAIGMVSLRSICYKK